MRPDKLFTTQQELKQQLSSLHEAQGDLLDQLNGVKSGERDLLQVGWLRLNLAQVNQDIEDTACQLASVSRQRAEKGGSRAHSHLMVRGL